MSKNILNHYSTINEENLAFETGENFASLFENREVSHVKEGSIVKGKVIKISGDFAVVDLGLKNEGLVALKEFQIIETDTVPVVGDEIEVYLDKFENRHGATTISREKAIREEYWKVLDKAMHDKKPITGVIFGKVKGGFTVDLNGIIGFLPASQVDARPVKDIGPLMGIDQQFIILKIDREQGNIVVSRRAILEGIRDEEKEVILAKINEGDVLEGVVKNITDYGAFVDFGKFDGLVHVTDISWGRINHPSEILTLGQTVKAQVIKFNRETKRISLGMKQLEKNPWVGIEERFPKGSQHKGKITNITDYGAFIELEPGIEGLVYVSEISWSRSNQNPKKMLKLNTEVDYVVLDIDISKHRISLGMKQCIVNPWQLFADKYPVGSVVEGEIKNVVDFGLFIGFEHDIDGLVHASDLSWSDADGMKEIKKYKKGDIIKAKVSAVDVEKERISLSVKHLSEAPSETFLTGHTKGEVVTCVVKEVGDDEIIVTIDGGDVEAVIKKGDLGKDRQDQKASRFAIGEKVDAKIVSFDKTNQKVNLSIKALEVDQHNKAIKDFGSTDSGASLGDILGAAISASKESK
jgi:small subunit ribosomal protein S1